MDRFREWICAPRVVGLVLALLSNVICAPAANAYDSFRILELYSNEDGSVQYVTLQEALGRDDECHLAGRELWSIRGQVARVFTFPEDLPGPETSRRHILIATPGFVELRLVTPDYIVPGPFLFPEGGTLVYASVDVVTHAALPTDELLALNRLGLKVSRSPVNFRGDTKYGRGPGLRSLFGC